MTRRKESLPLQPLAYHVGQAAQVLSLSEDVIRRLIDKGDLPALRLGRSLRIPVWACERLVGLPIEAGDFDAFGSEAWSLKAAKIRLLQGLAAADWLLERTKATRP